MSFDRKKQPDIDGFIQRTIADGHSQDPSDIELFVPVPETDGLLDYGHILPEVAAVTRLRQLPIRLLNGRERAEGGFGVAHMLHQHGTGMALHGHYSVQDFVDVVARDFNAVYSGRSGRSLIVRRKSKHFALDRLLVLELAKSNKYYEVISGWVVSSRRPINGMLLAEKIDRDGVLVWECRAPHSAEPG